MKKHNFLLESPKMGPVNLVIMQSTGFCNFACTYCYLTKESRAARGRMSMEVVEATFRNLFSSKISHNKFTVVWHAGEPLTAGIPFYEKTFQLIESLRPDSCQISHSFQTNGSLMDEKWCEFIKKWDVRIGLSIDGPKHIHDQYRIDKLGRGTFDSAMNAISLMDKNRISFSTISVVTKETLKDPQGFSNFFIENKIKSVGFNIEEIEGFNSKSSLDQISISEEFRNFTQIFYNSTKNINNLRVREFHAAEQTILKSKRQQSTQAIPMTLINVAMNGNYSTFSPELLTMDSGKYGNFIFGNVLTDSFDDIWKNPNFQEVFSDIQSGLRKCFKTCEFADFCGGGHPSNKFSENGSFDSTETLHCKLLKKSLLHTVAEDMLKNSPIEASL